MTCLQILNGSSEQFDAKIAILVGQLVIANSVMD